jgi:hypothetical protein
MLVRACAPGMATMTMTTGIDRDFHAPVTYVHHTPADVAFKEMIRHPYLSMRDRTNSI